MGNIPLGGFILPVYFGGYLQFNRYIVRTQTAVFPDFADADGNLPNAFSHGFSSCLTMFSFSLYHSGPESKGLLPEMYGIT